jgi:glycosyltransferase involved in cell wall biosynthesis
MSNTQRKIRLVQIIRGFDIGGANGGSDRFSIELARSLDRSQFELAICAFFQHHTSAEARWLEVLESEGIQVHFLTGQNGKGRFSTLWLGVKNLCRFLQAWQADLCHSHCQLGTVAAIWMKVRGVIPHAMRTAHGWLEWNPNWMGWLLDKIFSGWAYPLLLDAEVGVSQAAVDRLAGHAGTRLSGRKPIMIYNAIPLMPIESKDICIRSQPDPFVAGSVGRLSEQKGYRYLIDAIPLIIREFPQIEFWLIGDGELRSDLESQSKRLGVQDHVKFLGKRRNVMSLLRQMDLFVLPSLWEGLPTVIIESMSQGVPVLATDIPGTREMIEAGKTGWLVPMQDSTVLARATIQILQNPQARLKVSLEALKVVDRFSITKIAAQYEGLYQSIIKDRV